MLDSLARNVLAGVTMTLGVVILGNRVGNFCSKFYSEKKSESNFKRKLFLRNFSLQIKRSPEISRSHKFSTHSKAGEFVDLPYIKLPKFSKFSNYFLCLLATTHFAWANLGRTFSGRNSPAGGNLWSLLKIVSLFIKNTFKMKTNVPEIISSVK